MSLTNEFENDLIFKEETYKNGLHPKVPKSEKQGVAVILTGGCKDDIVVDKYTTVKEIRQGKYTQLVEISTRSYIKEIKFHSPSKESCYSFDVYVKGVIQVNDPIIFYKNKNLDVDAYFNNLFSLDVKKVTRKYGILDYKGMDDELKQALSLYTIDESTGFVYQISVVDAAPGEEAKEYVRKYEKMLLDDIIRKRTKDIAKSITITYQDAIMSEFVEGNLTQTEAILKIEEYEKANYDEKIRHLDDLREKGVITDIDFRKSIQSTLKLSDKDDNLNQNTQEDSGMNQFYSEEE